MTKGQFIKCERCGKEIEDIAGSRCYIEHWTVRFPLKVCGECRTKWNTTYRKTLKDFLKSASLRGTKKEKKR